MDISAHITHMRRALALARQAEGRTGRPMGYPHQAWSAGMYLYAFHCVQDGWLPVFDAAEGW